MADLLNLPAWSALEDHFKSIESIHLKDLFKDSSRFQEFSIQLNDILLDYSKNRIDSKTLSLLTQLATESGVKEGIQAMFAGEQINNTEKRSVLHIALRNQSNTPILVDGKDVMPQINDVLG